MPCPRRQLITCSLFLAAALTAQACVGVGTKKQSSRGRRGHAAAPAQGGRGAPGVIKVSGASPRPIAPLAFGLNYWSWVKQWGAAVVNTQDQVKALAPALIRIGGQNNDTNQPEAFGLRELDAAVAYVKAVGAEALLQVPVIKDADGNEGTPESAAAMVRYVNVEKKYGVKYFSIGNEPDIYAMFKVRPTSYTATDHCARFSAFARAMKAVDPSIKIVGPDLSNKYRAGDDWLTPFLRQCGADVDIVAIHRYPMSPTATKAQQAATDGKRMRTLIKQLKSKLVELNLGDRPLAITETNVTWDGAPEKSRLEASPGTLLAGLWAADAFGVALEEGLWTHAFWSISEGWTLGIIADNGEPRPAYHALKMFSDHFGTAILDVTEKPKGFAAYAGRTSSDDGTALIVINHNATDHEITFSFNGMKLENAGPWTFPGRSITAVRLPDKGSPQLWRYGADEWKKKAEATPLNTP